jgi:hypothetical protein
MARLRRIGRRNDTLIGIHPDEEAAILCAMRESLKTSPPCISSDRLIEERANAAISSGLAFDLVDYEVLQTLAARKRKGRKRKSGHSSFRKGQPAVCCPTSEKNDIETSLLRNKRKTGKGIGRPATQDGNQRKTNKEYSKRINVKKNVKKEIHVRLRLSVIGKEECDSLEDSISTDGTEPVIELDTKRRRKHAYSDVHLLKHELTSMLSNESTVEEEDVMTFPLPDSVSNEDSRSDSDSDFEPVKKKKQMSNCAGSGTSTTRYVRTVIFIWDTFIN